MYTKQKSPLLEIFVSGKRMEDYRFFFEAFFFATFFFFAAFFFAAIELVDVLIMIVMTDHEM